MRSEHLERFFNHRVFKVALVFLIILAVLWLGLHVAWNIYLRQKLGEERYREMKAFYKEEVILPDEFLQPFSYPQKVITLIQSLGKANAQITDCTNWEQESAIRDKLRKVQELSDEEYEFILGRRSEREPFISVLEELVMHPDYEMMAVIQAQDCMSLVRMRTVMSDQILYECYQGRHEDALETALYALQCFRHPARTTLIHHGLAASGEAYIVRTCNDLAWGVDDPDILKESLKRLIEIREDILPDLPNDVRFWDIITGLRYELTKGGDVRIPKQGTRADYQDELSRVSLRTSGFGFSYSHDLLKLFPFLVNTPYYREFGYTVCYFFDTLPNYYSWTQVYYDLFCLKIAQRLAKLEAEEAPDRPAPEALSFFETQPLDPFTEEPYLWDATQEQFYSIGPDLTDDHMAILYEPNLFIDSPTEGDIFLTPPEGNREVDMSHK